jgi:hypothetical protein
MMMNEKIKKGKSISETTVLQPAKSQRREHELHPGNITGGGHRKS